MNMYHFEAEDGAETQGSTPPFRWKDHCDGEAAIVAAGQIDADPQEEASPGYAVYLGYLSREIAGCLSGRSACFGGGAKDVR
jgi:hypothetical protein